MRHGSLEKRTRFAILLDCVTKQRRSLWNRKKGADERIERKKKTFKQIKVWNNVTTMVTEEKKVILIEMGI